MQMGLEAKNKTGYFLFSLDTELAWGYFDLDRSRREKFSPDGSRERTAIARLIELLDEFDIAATWAVVGHLFYEKCEKCEVCPVLVWQGKFRSFELIYGTAATLWYGADIIERLLASGSMHEIAFHGYTHRVFDEHEMSQQEARTEILEWLRAASRNNISPHAVIFPRNRIGHLDVFKEAGYVCYRGNELLPKDYAIPLIGKALNRIDLLLQMRTPQVYEAKVEPSGLVNLPASAGSFDRTGELRGCLTHLASTTCTSAGSSKGWTRRRRNRRSFTSGFIPVNSEPRRTGTHFGICSDTYLTW